MLKSPWYHLGSLDIDIPYELVMLILYIKSREIRIIYKSRDKNVHNNIARNSKTQGKTQMIIVWIVDELFVYLCNEIRNNNQIEQIIATPYMNVNTLLFSEKNPIIKYSTKSSLLKLKQYKLYTLYGNI